MSSLFCPLYLSNIRLLLFFFCHPYETNKGLLNLLTNKILLKGAFYFRILIFYIIRSEWGGSNDNGIDKGRLEGGPCRLKISRLLLS